MADCPTCGGTHFPDTGKCPFTLAACIVCGAPTIWACSDCAIEGRGSVHICNHEPCRDQHEHDNPQHPVASKVEVSRYNPFERDNQSLTYKRIDAAIIKAESPAPPVAEPLIAEKNK